MAICRGTGCEIWSGCAKRGVFEDGTREVQVTGLGVGNVGDKALRRSCGAADRGCVACLCIANLKKCASRDSILALALGDQIHRSY